MDFQRDREDTGGRDLAAYLAVTLARIKVLAHLSPQSLTPRKSPGRVDSGPKNRVETLKQGEDKAPPTHSRDPLPTPSASLRGTPVCKDS